MPHKKILIYFTKKEIAADPYAHLPEQRAMYWAIFQEGLRRGHDIYLGVRSTVHHGGLTFENVLLFTGKEFELQSGKITFDAIYDRSIRKDFPTPDIDHKTLNTLAFKRLANNKGQTYELLKKFMPKTFTLSSQTDFMKALTFFEKGEMAVFKPIDSFGGKGVVIAPAGSLSPDLYQAGKRFILQKFVDTQNGVPGLCAGRHDLRVIIINGSPILIQVREPVRGGLVANVSQGGTSSEFPYESAPASLRSIVETVHPLIDAAFSSPFYSIDFGIDADGTPYIFEINDQIGLRGAITGKNRELFCKNLLDALEKRATL